MRPLGAPQRCRLSSLIATAGIARAANRYDSGERTDRKIGNRGQGSASWCRSGFGSTFAAHTASSPEGASGIRRLFFGECLHATFRRQFCLSPKRYAQKQIL